MRILCLLTKSPVPADSGTQQRLYHLLLALARLGTLDLVFDRPVTDEVRAEVEAAFPVSRLFSPSAPPVVAAGPRRWLRLWSLPSELASMDPSLVRRELASFMAESPEPYGLVWSFGLTRTWIFEPVLDGIPRIDDLADVTWVLAERVLEAARRAPTANTWRGRRRRLRVRLSRDRWARFERDMAGRARLVTVCSEDDRRALGVPGTIVVPNGYVRPISPRGRTEVSQPPVVLLAGLMTYDPNIDGAVWCADEVLPLLRAQIPDARLLIVGRSAAAVQALDQREGVEVAGYVPVIDEVLGRADAVVVPLRQGSGTRIKILEAWAHRLPVVSTTVGAEGLGVESGREAIIADSAVAIAAGLERVLVDRDLRNQLVEHGAGRFESDFDWDRIESEFAAVVLEVLLPGSTGRPPSGDRLAS